MENTNDINLLNMLRIHEICVSEKQSYVVYVFLGDVDELDTIDDGGILIAYDRNNPSHSIGIFNDGNTFTIAPKELVIECLIDNGINEITI